MKDSQWKTKRKLIKNTVTTTETLMEVVLLGNTTFQSNHMETFIVVPSETQSISSWPKRLRVNNTLTINENGG